MSNLLKDASILLTPTAYENGRMNAIKPSKDLYGSELVTNGDFATDSDWNKGTGWSISSSRANRSGIAANSYMGQDFNVEQGKKYIIKYDRTYISGNGETNIFSYFDNNSTRTTRGIYRSTIQETVTVTDTFTSNFSSNLALRIYGIGDFTGSIDNVSVVEDSTGDFQFSRNSAATRVNAQGLVENVQIISPELVSNGNFSQIGTEEVLNGNFSQEGSEVSSDVYFNNPSNWTLTGQSSVSNGRAHIVQDNTANTGVTSNTTITNKTYKITGVVSDYVSGSVGFSSIGSTTPRELIPSQNGEFTIYYTSTRSTPSTWNIQRIVSPCDLKIDNVSVKEVGQNWSLGSGWSIGDGVAVATDAPSGQKLRQSGQLTTGKTYKVVYEVTELTLGMFRAVVGAVSGALVDSVGTHTEYITAASSDFYIRAIGTTSGSITNISVKEVGQDWTLGTGWSVDQANNKAVATSSPSGQSVGQNSVASSLSNGSLAQVSFQVLDITQGSFGIYFSGTLVGSLNSVGTFNASFTKGTETSFYIRALGTTSGSISNISVKEITDDTDIPRINYEGFSYQDSLGSEEVVNGDFATDSDWTKGANWTISGGKATSNGTGLIYQTGVTYLDDKQYKVTFNADITSGNFTVRIGNTSSSVAVTQGLNTHYLSRIPSNTTGYLFFQGNGVGSIDNVSVKEYLGQEVVPDSGCGSWLLEPQSTNLVTYSEDFSNSSYSKASGGLGSVPIVTSKYSTSPSGEQNADRIQFDLNGGTSSSDSSWIFTFPALDVDGVVSIYLKTNDDSTKVVYFRNTFGTIDNVTVNGNWQRYSITNPTTRGFYLGLRGSQGNSDNADLSVWGAQVEQQSYATSYIPTNGATNTRLQDIANNSGNATLINSTEGVLYAEIAALADDLSSRIISLSDGTNTNRIHLFYFSQSNDLVANYRVGGSTVVSFIADLTDITNFSKVAFKWESGDFKMYVDGTLIGTNTNTTMLPSGTLDVLSFMRGDGSFNFYGKNKALAVYKEALTDANLRCLTYPNPVATTFDLDFDTIAEQFTFTRGSEATFVNEQGLIESTNQIGPELITNGDFSSGSTGWTSYGTVNISNGIATIGASSNSGIFQGILTQNKSYKVTFNVLSYDGVGNAQVINDAGTQLFSITQPGSYTFYFKHSIQQSNIIFRGTANALLSIDNVSVKEVISATNTPRIDYSTGEAAFLLEPQSTNYSLNSDQPSTWHSSNGVTITPNATTSPEGEQNSSLAVVNTSSGNIYTRNLFNFPSGSGLQTVTTSFFVKHYNNQWVRLRSIFFTGSPANGKSTYFDIQNGIVGTSDATHIAKMEDYGNGWYRCSITFDIDKSSDNSGYGQVEAMDGDNSGTYAAIGQGYYAFGSQGEELSYPTSYIPTSGAYATRNQELCYDATPVINSEEGTLYAEISALADDENVYKLLEINNGGITDRVYIAYRNNSVYVAVIVGGVTQFVKATSTSITSVADFNKIAVKYKENDFALWINGVEVATDAIGITSANGVLNSIDFSNSSNGIPFFGNTKGLKYYPKALADVQLEDLTTI